MKKVTKRIFAAAMCIAMIIMSAVPAFAVTYVENHDYVDCSNYYIDGSKYIFLIKIPIGTPLEAITVKSAYSNTSTKLSELTAYWADKIEYQYSDSTSDCYMYTFDCSLFGAPKYSLYYYGIKLYYDYNGKHYMATNTSYNSTTEGPGYKLVR